MQLTARVLFVITLVLASSFGARSARADDEDDNAQKPAPAAPAARAAVPTKAADAEAPSAPSVVDVKAGSEVAMYGDSDHVYVFTPSIYGTVENPTAGWSLNGHYLVDVVSAASVDIVSTASPRWIELRHAGGADVTYKPGNTGIGVSGSTSVEPDYTSYAASGSLMQDFDDRNLSVRLTFGGGHDTIGRHDTPFSVFSRTLDHYVGSLSLSNTLSRSTVLTLIGDVVLERGDQSKPYRYVPMFTASDATRIVPGAPIGYVNQHRLPTRVLEQLPLQRDRGAFTLRVAHRWDTATIRLDERVYADSWQMVASTTDLRWLLDASRRFTYGPHARFHAQKAVSFWQIAYISSGPADIPALRTGDRELGPLWSATFGPGAKWGIGPAGDPFQWTLGTDIEATWTGFLNDLYIRNRLAGLGLVSLEGTF
jgi:hypothetical protein